MLKPFFLLFFFALFFLFTSESLAQEDLSNNKQIQELKTQISKAEGVEKLRLTDSLLPLIEFNEEKHYSSIIKENIALALSLDSITSATKHTANLMYFHNVISNNPKAGLATFNDFKGKEKEGEKYKYKIRLYLYGADSYTLQGDFKSALKTLEVAKTYAVESKEDNLIAPVYYRMGFIQSRSGDLAEASQNMQKARTMFLAINDTLQYVNSNLTLATLYDLIEFYDEAKAVRDETIEISKLAKDKPSLSILYYYQSIQYNLIDNQKERIRYANLALDAVETSTFKDYYKPGIVLNAATAYAQNDSISKADVIMTSLDAYPHAKTPEFQGGVYTQALGELALVKGNYKEALQYGEEYLAMQKVQDNYESIYNAEKFLADVYKEMGDSTSSNEHLVAYYKIKDSITSVKKVQTLSYYQTLYETEKRDLKIEAQQSDIALLDQKNKVKNQWILFGSLGLLALFGFVWVLRSRNFAKRKQRLRENFTKDLLKTQEAERARIASELHDSVGQKLLIIKNSFVGKEKEASNEIDLVGETIKEVREMSHNLHPFQFEKLGLIKSLKNMVETFQKNSNVFHSEDIEMEDVPISKEKEIYVFRMLQECLTNVEKHADATACNLTVTETNKHLIFQLKDNGKGFKTPDNLRDYTGLGMKTLQERAQFIDASLTLNSQPEKGTTICIKVQKS